MGGGHEAEMVLLETVVPGEPPGAASGGHGGEHAGALVHVECAGTCGKYDGIAI